MCHRNQLLGCALMSLGVGIFVGTLLSSGFLCCLIGLAALLSGLWLCQKR